MNRKLWIDYTVTVTGGHPRGSQLMAATSQLQPNGSARIVRHVFKTATVVKPQVRSQISW